MTKSNNRVTAVRNEICTQTNRFRLGRLFVILAKPFSESIFLPSIHVMSLLLINRYNDKPGEINLPRFLWNTMKPWKKGDKFFSFVYDFLKILLQIKRCSNPLGGGKVPSPEDSRENVRKVSLIFSSASSSTTNKSQKTSALVLGLERKGIMSDLR